MARPILRLPYPMGFGVDRHPSMAKVAMYHAHNRDMRTAHWLSRTRWAVAEGYGYWVVPHPETGKPVIYAT